VPSRRFIFLGIAYAEENAAPRDSGALPVVVGLEIERPGSSSLSVRSKELKPYDIGDIPALLRKA
jgi:hypothetical protein